MGWEDVPIWIKSAIIGAADLALIFGCLLLPSLFFPRMSSSDTEFINSLIRTWLLTIPIGGIIGALIGLIIQKIKEKNYSQNL